MSERIGWDRRLSVTTNGKGLVGHAGVVLLHKLADRVGLTPALAGLWPEGQGATWRDRAHVLISLAAAIVCGARSMLEAERLQAHQAALFGTAPSDSTTHRTLAGLDEPMLARIATARAKIRRHVWQLLHLRPGGFPWLTVAGKRLRGWIVIDIDATVITAASDKNGAAVTFKKTYGFQCAMRRSDVSPAQPEGTRKEVPGPNDSP
ncbi:transposase [Nonomuraea rhizosphaerae]|uniref:transposase n=1 Tax=Nonomuraea rhizosphaerae TaxID=2665663 RepID=UPI0027E247B8|nr:transposase [Nonomuraea rhizosphaerae]